MEDEVLPPKFERGTAPLSKQPRLKVPQHVLFVPHGNSWGILYPPSETHKRDARPPCNARKADTTVGCMGHQPCGAAIVYGVEHKHEFSRVLPVDV